MCFGSLEKGVHEPVRGDPGVREWVFQMGCEEQVRIPEAARGKSTCRSVRLERDWHGNGVSVHAREEVTRMGTHTGTHTGPCLQPLHAQESSNG